MANDELTAFIKANANRRDFNPVDSVSNTIAKLEKYVVKEGPKKQYYQNELEKFKRIQAQLAN